MDIKIGLVELANWEELSQLAKYSIEAVRAIKKKYESQLVEAGHDILVYERMADEYSGAGYLTPDWHFKFMDSWTPEEVFEMPVVADEVFSVLKADFFVKTKQSESLTDEERNKAKYAFYVREWIEKVKRW